MALSTIRQKIEQKTGADLAEISFYTGLVAVFFMVLLLGFTGFLVIPIALVTVFLVVAIISNQFFNIRWKVMAATLSVPITLLGHVIVVCLVTGLGIATLIAVVALILLLSSP